MIHHFPGRLMVVCVAGVMDAWMDGLILDTHHDYE
jgi:hypothetical protein